MGYVRTKHFAVSWGYDLPTDSWFGLRVYLGYRKPEPQCPHYRFAFRFYFDWPKLTWAHETWAVDEAGYLRGLPVMRQGVRSSAWTGREWHLRGVEWYRGWSWIYYG